jgi:hypothetical protein
MPILRRVHFVRFCIEPSAGDETARRHHGLALFVIAVGQTVRLAVEHAGEFPVKVIGLGISID